MFSTGYMDFSQPEMPVEWRAMLDGIAPGLTAAVDQQTTTPSQDWVETLARTLSVVAMTEQQRRLMSIQLDRARAGLPPLQASQYAPGVQLDIGLEKAVMIGTGLLLVGWLLTKGSAK